MSLAYPPLCSIEISIGAPGAYRSAFRNQVRDRLLDPEMIPGADRAGLGVDRACRTRCLVGKALDDLFCDFAEVARLAFEFEAARRDPRDVEQVVDETRRSLHVKDRLADLRAHSGLESVTFGKSSRARISVEHATRRLSKIQLERRHRGAELVRSDREKLVADVEEPASGLLKSEYVPRKPTRGALRVALRYGVRS